MEAQSSDSKAIHGVVPGALMGNLSNRGTAMGPKLGMGPRMGPASVYMACPESREFTENKKHHGQFHKKLRQPARITKTRQHHTNTPYDGATKKPMQ